MGGRELPYMWHKRQFSCLAIGYYYKIAIFGQFFGEFFNIILGVFVLNGVEMCTKRGQKSKIGLKVDLVKISRVTFLRTFVVEPSSVPGIILIV